MANNINLWKYVGYYKYNNDIHTQINTYVTALYVFHKMNIYLELSNRIRVSHSTTMHSVLIHNNDAFSIDT